MLKLTRRSKAAANAALLDLPDSFPPAAAGDATTTFDVYLFEFRELDKTVVHPALLFRKV